MSVFHENRRHCVIFSRLVLVEIGLLVPPTLTLPRKGGGDRFRYCECR